MTKYDLEHSGHNGSNATVVTNQSLMTPDFCMTGLFLFLAAQKFLIAVQGSFKSTMDKIGVSET